MLSGKSDRKKLFTVIEVRCNRIDDRLQHVYLRLARESIVCTSPDSTNYTETF